MLKIMLVLFLVVFDVCAAEVVDIFGAANTPSGKQTKAHISFDEVNEPVFVINEAPSSQNAAAQKLPQAPVKPKPKEINQLSVQDPKPFSISPEAEQNEIENTLYEGGDRIYDVQSFPLKDIKTITEPNIDPTISTYPEY